MALRQIPRIVHKDKALVRILEPMRQQLMELSGGSQSGLRAVRFADLLGLRGLDFSDRNNGLELAEPAFVRDSSVLQAEIDARIDALVPIKLEISELAKALFEGDSYADSYGALIETANVIKININGYVAGYGLAVTGGDDAGTIQSTFIIQADRFAVIFPTPPWVDGTVYSVGDFVTPIIGGNTGLDGTGKIYECTTGGTSDSSEPTWPTSAPDTVVDNTVTWTTRDPSANVPFIVGVVGGVTTVGISGSLIVDGTIIADALTVSQLSAIAADLGAITAGTITLDTAGHIKSGQTAYDTGTGFFLGQSSGVKFSLGDSSGNKLTWNGTVLEITGSLTLTNTVQTFTPTWGAGFSTDPTGDMSYIDLGAIVILWSGQLTGDSDTNAMTVTNLPSAIRPGTIRIVPCMVTDNGSAKLGATQIETGGDITFSLFIADTGVSDNIFVSTFTPSGTKGLPSGWLVVYSK